ncbi:MAG: DUF6666 family protein [Pirellulaceae bacterium]
MIGSAGSNKWLANGLAIGLIAGGLLLADAPVALAQRTATWGPTRDAVAVIQTDDEQAIGTGIDLTGSYGGERALPGNSLRARRPERLMPRGTVGQLHTQVTQGPTIVEELPLSLGLPTDSHVAADCASCGDNSCGQCVDCCGQWNSCGPVSPCCLLPCPRLDNLELLAGVQGFTGPANRGGSGSFGFYEGFNHAIPLCRDVACGQFGARWTQSNFDGSFVSPEERTQIFLTTGLFRRVDWGLQAGVVFDYLHDEWDYEADLGQLRGEIGWKFACRDEVGFRFSVGVNDDTSVLNEPILSDDGQELTLRQRTAQFEVNDLFAFYYRRQFACGGEGRLFGGFTNNQQGLFGGDARVPLSPCWSLSADFLYVVPSNESAAPGYVEETWNVAVGVVWTPFAKPGCGPNYGRPLLDVANNGTFATRLQ